MGAQTKAHWNKYYEGGMSMNATNMAMKFNKITLSFSGGDESLFREKYFADSIIQFRISFIIVTILYGAFGYLDTRVIPEYADTFHAIRFLFVIPLFITVLLLSFTPVFQKIWQVLLLISFIAGGAGISIMTMLAPDNYAYYAGMMLVFSAGYFFIRLRFFLATIAGWSILLVYNIGAVFYAHTPDVLLVSNNFFFISANLIGMFAAYNIEYFSRRNFFLSKKLDFEKLLVLEVNKNLEITVSERTKELLKAKEKAEESDRLKTAFLQNMSHEIRTPMNAIMGFSELLVKHYNNKPKLEKYSEIINRRCYDLLDIINDILDIAKIESGQLTAIQEECNLNVLFDELKAFFSEYQKRIGKQHIKFNLEAFSETSETIVVTDRVKLKQIFINLISNAFKFTENGTIEGGFTVDENRNLLFFVTDTGIGIPCDKQQLIFERFAQVEHDSSRIYGGTGLGLSIVKGLVNILGGEIFLESETGKGSKFSFTIPYKKPIEIKPETF